MPLTTLIIRESTLYMSDLLRNSLQELVCTVIIRPHRWHAMYKCGLLSQMYRSLFCEWCVRVCVSVRYDTIRYDTRCYFNVRLIVTATNPLLM